MKTIQQLTILAALAVLAACGSDPKKPTPQETAPAPAEMQDSKATAPEKAAPAPAKPPKETISHDAKANPAAEDALMTQILDLPEIQKMDKAIRKKSDGKRGLNTYISGRPSDDREYYSVSVAEDNGSSMATYYMFHVYPDNSIMVYDAVEDKELTLKAWRKSL